MIWLARIVVVIALVAFIVGAFGCGVPRWGGLALFWFWPQVAKAIVFAASLCVLGLVGLFMLSARAIAWLDETAARQTR